MIDSGAERSIIPPSLAPELLVHPCNVALSGVDGKLINTYGQISGSLLIKSLRSAYTVSFIVAQSKPILGADFLTEHGFCIDMKKRLLTDTNTNISTKLALQLSHRICVTKQCHEDIKFLTQFYPTLCSAPDYTNLPTTSISHEIKTTEGPVFSKPRPLSPAKLETARKAFDTLLRLNIIRPSSSPWASPLHLVKKKDGTFRPCGDYRRINAMTLPDKYPIPNIQHRYFLSPT